MLWTTPRRRLQPGGTDMIRPHNLLGILSSGLAATAMANAQVHAVPATEPLSQPSNAYGLTNIGGKLFFAADDGLSGTELWKSDGTVLGTMRVKDINPGTGNSYPGYLTNLNGVAIFGADDGTHGYELWRSSGTGAGTTMIKDINPGASSTPD